MTRAVNTPANMSAAKPHALPKGDVGVDTYL